ncbi:MAG: cation transporter, partial [Anaerolineales bacterium]|nr:cation transporter [Anaerolineales bacterium]
MTDEFELRITGMDCADCALTLRESVARLDGVQVCTVNFGTGRMRVSGSVAAAAVSGAVTALGYGVAARAAPGEHNDESVLWLRLLRSPRNALTLVGMLLIGLAFAAQAAASNLAVILFALGALAGLYFPVRAGWVALRSRRGLDMNVLMTIAALGAFAIGEHAEAATVIVLFSLGEALEGFTLERARESIRFLTALAPAEATLVQACMDCEGHRGRELPDGSGLYRTGPCPWCDTHTQTVAVASLALGDVIMVMPGERIPMDGVVRSGQSAVNQAPITGESMPVEKSVGAHVFAGTVNGEGALEIEVTRLAQDNTLARMIHLVEQAQEQKSPAQRFIDRFARVYTPAVVGVAVVVAALPPLLFGQ